MRTFELTNDFHLTSSRVKVDDADVKTLALAIDTAHGRPNATARAIEFQRQMVLLARRHRIGNHPLTGALPVSSDFQFDIAGLSQYRPEFYRERLALMAEFADGRESEMWLRHVTFTEAELAAE